MTSYLSRVALGIACWTGVAVAQEREPLPVPPAAPNGNYGWSAATTSWDYRVAPGRDAHGCRPGLWHGHIKPWLHESHWGYREYFYAPPLGESVYHHMNAQVGNSQAAQLCLYHYDFFDGPLPKAATLNAAGRRRLAKMAGLLAISPLPLQIEEVADDEPLNEARRIEVLRQLGVMLVPEGIAPHRVIVVPRAPGLNGIEALEIRENVLQHLRSGPTGTGGRSGGSGPAASGTFPAGAAGGATGP